MKDVLIIDRAKWNVGEPWVHSTGEMYLLNEKGFMCCLGFECIRRGFTAEQILWKYEPNELRTEIPDLSVKDDDDYRPTYFVRRAIEINDDPMLLKEDREDKIKDHFATIGVEVQYINQYA